MGVPFVTRVPPQSRAVIAGIPFDGGQHATRLGARLGPQSVREQSLQLRPVDPDADLDVLAELGLVDVGDARVRHGELEASQRSIAEFAGVRVEPLRGDRSAQSDMVRHGRVEQAGVGGPMEGSWPSVSGQG
ncbi:arginase family protein, partial [Bradyrhizobium uaiense]